MPRFLFGLLGLFLVIVARASPLAVTPAQIRQVLQDIADAKSKTYNCSVSIAFKNADWEVSAAGGIVDFESGQKASVDDTYAWGSGTKPLTGASILKLISEGHFGLETPAHKIVDPLLQKSSKMDPTQNFTSMADLWGAENVTGITIGQLLNMTSGIPDFDTAKGGHGVATDSLRLELYKNPKKAYTPQQLLALPWVANHFKPCIDQAPHWHKCYSSTNFMLLGLILANGTEWDKFDQGSFLPPSLQKSSSLKFAVSGAPDDYSPVHGYDRTSYNMPKGSNNNQDVAGVDGVFAGWTASDLVATATDVAALGWGIYGPSPTVLPKAYADMMAATALSRDYGLATFNLARDSGQQGKYGEAYGHLGATYGFQSQLVYFPGLQFVLTVATNIESNSQTQPKDALCFAYNTIAGKMLGQDIKCTFAPSSYYGSGCNCTQMK
jgi:CubicO group peptidase (beta-lactamase class C family)